MSAEQPSFPLAFVRADAFSLVGQSRTLRGTSVRLVLIVVATLLLGLSPLWPSHYREHHEFEYVGLAAAVLFLVALVMELWLLRRHPERDWYDGRAVAESAKTLSWRYAVGGSPYPIAEEADTAFRRDIESLAKDLAVLAPAVTGGSEPTVWMRDLRSRDFAERRDHYLRERVRDQEGWYTRKAAYNRSRARQWIVVLLAAEAVGVALAVLKSVGVLSVDLASVAAAIIASGVAWTALKQHESVGAAYTLASKELGEVRLSLLQVESEEDWVYAVASAEEAISREHTMWRASRATG